MAIAFFRSLFSKKPENGKDNGGRPETPIRLFDTRFGNLRDFTSLHPKEVRMYNCGPTVYGYAHVGNLRSYVFADTIKRTLIQSGFSVKQVINITDVGHLTSDADEGADKMEEGAKRAGLKANELAKIYTEAFLEDLSALNVEITDTLFPRASEHVTEQIMLVKTLEDKGFTYKTSDGVYFDTSKFPSYGALGHIDIAGLKEGARVVKNPEKKNPTDFALWKFSKQEEKRQQEWASPWGIGFPGWHIECSAMSMKYLGTTLDIHTGGVDHIPVHHNNEIAQSEAATERPFSRYWMHNEFVQVEGRKISKSLGNGITRKHLEEKSVSPLSFRYWLLGAHYRTKVNFTWSSVEGAQNALFKLRKFFIEKLPIDDTATPDQEYLTRFRERMHDDLDTPRAIAIMWELVKDNKVPPNVKRATLLEFDNFLGLGLAESDENLSEMLLPKTIREEELPDDIRILVNERKLSRDKKDWKKADELRATIEAAGYSITDSAEGTVYRNTKEVT